ncbi:MAG: DUF937 domain-containing protein [Pirellulaceae bacterium]
MSSILEMIQEKLGQEGVSQLSQRIGASESQTNDAIGAALPALVGALGRKGSDDQGMGSLLGMLDRDGDGNILDDLPGFLSGNNGATQSHGIGAGDLLGSLLGGNQSRVENGVQKASGLSGDATKNLLSMLAPMVLGALSKSKQSQGLDSTGLKDFLGKEKVSVEKKTGGLIGRLLDQDGDGDFDLSDVAKLAMGKIFGRK